MPYLVGVDEAGYGPNLGPLVVAATVWKVDEGIDGASLYTRLRRVVAGSPESAGKKKVCWADSKAIYRSGCGIERLEQGVLAALALVEQSPQQWRELWGCLDPACGARLDELPWHSGYSCRLPLWLEADGLAELTRSLRVGLERSGVRLAGLLSRVVFPGEFNGLVELYGNKAEALSRVSLELVDAALRLTGEGSASVYCDKHGGRNHYAPLVQRQFPDDWVDVRVESAVVSRYRFGPAERRVDIGFWEGGEQFLPTALASMTAKYLREAAMRPFNEYWCARVPGLEPTAGYPVDSYRFKKEIAATQRGLGVEDAVLWRCR